MTDPPEYSDPIVIPITITIPNPRGPRDTGRWGQLGEAIHPSFTDPGYFQRQAESAARIHIYRAQATGLPRYAPLVLPMPGAPDQMTVEEFKEIGRRARRRAEFAREQVARGDYGDALRYLLLGTPFPAEVDEPLGAAVHNEGPLEPPQPRPVHAPDLDAEAAEAEKDLETRQAAALDERHLAAAEQDALGNPVVRGDKTFDHGTEVADSRRGLQNTLDDLEAKITHHDRYVRPRPNDSIKNAREVASRIDGFLKSIKSRLPNLKE